MPCTCAIHKLNAHCLVICHCTVHCKGALVVAGYEGVEVALMLDLTCGERLRATRDQGQVSVNRGFSRRQNR